MGRRRAQPTDSAHQRRSMPRQRPLERTPPRYALLRARDGCRTPYGLPAQPSQSSVPPYCASVIVSMPPMTDSTDASLNPAPAMAWRNISTRSVTSEPRSTTVTLDVPNGAGREMRTSVPSCGIGAPTKLGGVVYARPTDVVGPFGIVDPDPAQIRAKRLTPHASQALNVGAPFGRERPVCRQPLRHRARSDPKGGCERRCATGALASNSDCIHVSDAATHGSAAQLHFCQHRM